MSQIRITPEELEDGATYVSGKASDIQTLASELKSKMEQIESNWEGAAQSAFVNSFEELYPTFSQQFPEVLEGISNQLKAAAQVMREADEKLQQAMQG